MRKLALVHKLWFDPSAVTDRWRLLFEICRDELGFELAFIEEATSIPPDVDLVLVSCAAKHLEDKRTLDILLGHGARSVVYPADYKPTRHAGATAVLARADLILAPEAAIYRQAFPGKRVEFFPYFYAPDARYRTLPWNATPKMRCLVSGPVNASYPLRAAAVKSPRIDILPHTGSHGAEKRGAVVRDAYARALNGYYCAVAGSLRDGITTKTFEIMAAGALAITDRLPDMDEAGLVPWEHYLPARDGDVARVIETALAATPDIEDIRRAGRALALSRHGIRHRIDQLRALLAEL